MTEGSALCSAGAAVGDNPAAGAVWARGQVRKLKDRCQVNGGSTELQKKIVDTSLMFDALSRFTAFVAVDRSAVVNKGGEGEMFLQPVEMPAGWAENAAMTPSGAVAYCMSPAAGLSRQYRCRAMPAAGAALDADSSDALLEMEGAEDAPASQPGKLRTLGLAPRSSGVFGWLRNLLGAIFRSKGTAQPAPMDLTEYRQRITESHQDLLAVTSADPNERWVALNKLRVELGRMLREIAQLGSPPAEVERLAHLLVQLQSLPTPGNEAALNLLWAEADEALREFAGIAVEGRRETFWA